MAMASGDELFAALVATSPPDELPAKSDYTQDGAWDLTGLRHDLEERRQEAAKSFCKTEVGSSSDSSFVRTDHSADPNECPPAPRLRSRSRMVEVDPLPEAGAASTPEAADGAGGSAAPSGPAHHASPVAAGDRVDDESPEVLSGEDLVLSLGLALLSLLLDPNGVIAAIQSDGGDESRREKVAALYEPADHPYGGGLLYDLEHPSDGGATTQPAHEILAEVVALIARLHSALRLEEAVWVKTLCLVERTLRAASVALDARNFRPLLLAAVSVASKENYDEAMKLSDVIRALPSLNLSSLRHSELAMLELIEWNATMWNRDEFVAYRDGLAALRGGNELGAFAARYGPLINVVSGTDIIVRQTPPAS